MTRSAILGQKIQNRQPMDPPVATKWRLPSSSPRAKQQWRMPSLRPGAATCSMQPLCQAPIKRLCLQADLGHWQFVIWKRRWIRSNGSRPSPTWAKPCVPSTKSRKTTKSCCRKWTPVAASCSTVCDLAFVYLCTCGLSLHTSHVLRQSYIYIQSP